MSKQDKVSVVVPAGVGPLQIEGFPADCARSQKGALHVRPGTMTITDGELSHIRKHHKEVARRFVVRPVVAKPAPVAAATPTPPPAEAPEAPEATPTPSPAPQRHTSQQRSGKGDRS